MSTKPISLSLINKRNNCLLFNDSKSKEIKWLAESAIKESTEKSDSSKNIASFIENCTGNNANKFYKICIDLLESYNIKNVNEKRLNSLTKLFIENVIPYVTDLNALNKYLDKHSNIGEDKIKLIKESVKDYKICDRIIRNHNNLSTVIDLKQFVNEHRHFSNEELFTKICEVIDTYPIPDYGKLNVAIEESTYLFESCCIDYTKKELVSIITDYFLLREAEVKEGAFNGYKKVLEDSRLLNKSARKSISYLYESENVADSKDIKDLINRYKTDEVKDMGKLKATITKIFAKSPESVIDELPGIFTIFRHTIIFGTFAAQPVAGLVLFAIDKLISMMIDQREAKRLSTYIDNEINTIERRIENAEDKNKKEELETYLESLKRCQEKVYDYCDKTCANEDNYGYDDFEESCTLQEFKLFKQQNLIRAAIDASKVAELNYNRIKKSAKSAGNKLKAVWYNFITPTPEEKAEIDSKKISTKIKDTASKIGDSAKELIGKVVDGVKTISLGLEAAEYSNMSTEELISLINTRDEIDIIISAIEVSDKNDKVYLVNEFTNVVSNINTNIKNYGARCVLVQNDFLIEFHIVSNSKIQLTEDEELIRESTIYSRDLIYMNNIVKIAETMEEYSNLLQESSTYSKLVNSIDNNMALDEAKCLFELLSMQPETTYNNFNILVEQYSDNKEDKYIIESTIHQACDNLIGCNIGLDQYLESAKLTNELLEAVDSKKNIKDVKSKVSNIANKAGSTISNGASKAAVTVKGINFNGLKLAMIKLKQDVVNLSSKEKELSRSIDIAVNGLTKGIEKALTSDKREAIIKGSIIPSFSKIIKIAAVFGGAAWAIDPTIAVIGLVGGLGMSKHFTNKERKMILDEIEVELKVVEREISRAEGSASPEKYRALLRYQAKLQKEYTGIKYGIDTSTRQVDGINKYLKGAEQ